MNKEEEKVYWEGFNDGMMVSLKHNINLMKVQLKSINDPKDKQKTGGEDGN